MANPLNLTISCRKNNIFPVYRNFTLQIDTTDTVCDGLIFKQICLYIMNNSPHCIGLLLKDWLPVLKSID